MQKSSATVIYGISTIPNHGRQGAKSGREMLFAIQHLDASFMQLFAANEVFLGGYS
jgi:hypothetical protein